MEQPEKHPPAWAMRLLRIVVHPEFREELEGDLLEKYQGDLQNYGPEIAQKRLYADLLSLIKPNLIFNISVNTMKTRSWLLLLLVPMAVVAASVAPFLPGPGNDLSHGISQFAHATGYIGLPFVPFGLLWLIVEMRNGHGQQLNRWTNGYYPAWLALSPVFFFLPFQITKTLLDGQTFNLPPFIMLIFVASFCIYCIRKLKNKTRYQFNPAPLYIVLIPVVALVSSRFLVEKAAEVTREKAIANTEPLIAAIEKYKMDNGEYPENLASLKGKYIQEIPQVNIMGMRPYQYERWNSSFQLSFERLWHWNATEVVVYNNVGQKGIKSNYKNYTTAHSNWWYYLAD